MTPRTVSAMQGLRATAPGDVHSPTQRVMPCIHAPCVGARVNPLLTWLLARANTQPLSCWYVCLSTHVMPAYVKPFSPGACDAGFTSDGTGGCQACAAGTYKTGSGNEACTECGAGKYSAASGATAESKCSTCTSNSDAPAGSDAASDCICNAGFTSDGAGACQACAAGTYKAGSGNEACTECGAGKYSNATNATAESTCTDCGAGKYSVTTGATAESTCSDCGAGKYSTVRNPSRHPLSVRKGYLRDVLRVPCACRCALRNDLRRVDFSERTNERRLMYTLPGGDHVSSRQHYTSGLHVQRGLLRAVRGRALSASPSLCGWIVFVGESGWVELYWRRGIVHGRHVLWRVILDRLAGYVCRQLCLGQPLQEIGSRSSTM